MAAAARMEAWEAKSKGTKCTEMEGCFELMALMMGVIFDSVRPARMRWEGRPAAIEMAVSAPMPPMPGPVMTTGFVRSEIFDRGRSHLLFLSFTLSLNASTTSLPVEEKLQRVILPSE